MIGVCVCVCRAVQATDNNMTQVHCTLDNQGYKHMLGIYRVIPSVLDLRKCEYLKDYSLDFEKNFVIYLHINIFNILYI
jgi:hypothetical protein